MKTLEQIKSELNPIFESTTFFFTKKETINEGNREEKLNELATFTFNNFNGDE